MCDGTPPDASAASLSARTGRAGGPLRWYLNLARPRGDHALARTRRDADWSRRYPPLAGSLLAVLIAVFVLPSALNVPLSNPGQTLEFAPVPPTDDAPPPDAGNTASLGLGSSSTAPSGETLGGEGAGADVGLPPPPTPPDGVGNVPVTKRCVGNPPRQTEDPLSPPCVAHFEGDNGGATYPGVEANEIRILIYVDPTNHTYGDRGPSSESDLRGRTFDLALPPDHPDSADDESATLRNMRRFQSYFNDRFQLYGRFARFFVSFATGPGGVESPETRRADAAGHLTDVRPFAVVTTTMTQGFDDDYIEVIAENGVLVFGIRDSLPEEYFQRYPGRVWSYQPSLEQRARFYASYVCEQVVDRPVVDSGNEGENGVPRRMGFLSTTDDRRPNLVRFASVVRGLLEDCGANIVDSATFPRAGAISSTGPDGGNPQYAAANMQRFAQNDVTTVIWPGGYETEHSKAAGTTGYLPEWIVAADGIHEGQTAGTFQHQGAWDHAWIVSTAALEAAPEDDPCTQALREADPRVGVGTGGDQPWACPEQYNDLRMLFTGIQVAGPNLTPTSMDKGFHAIPPRPSDDPRYPACFFEPGDYTCVKDAVAEFWDSEGQTEDGQVGCWRMVEDGVRHIAGDWPDGNIDVASRPDNLCNPFETTLYIF